MLFFAWGCDTADDIMLSPTTNAELKIEENILAAPKDKDENEDEGEDKEFYTEDIIGPDGGKLKIEDKSEKNTSSLKIPAGALKKDELLSMRVTIDGKERADFHFEPHGIKFKKAVTLELSYSYLKGVQQADLILYYLNDDGEWEKICDAEWIPGEKKCRFITDHFSSYYYSRR